MVRTFAWPGDSTHVSAFFHSFVESCKALGANVNDYLTHLLLNANTIKDCDEDAWAAFLHGECDVSDAKVYRERLLEAVPDPLRTNPTGFVENVSDTIMP